MHKAFLTFAIAMKSIFRLSILSVIFSLFFLSGRAQKALPVNEKTGRIYYEGTKKVSLKSKKKMMAIMKDWTSSTIDYPPMVFSVISASKDTLQLKAVTEIPSKNGLHPISFRLKLVPQRNAFWFSATEFYFEDIRLSLEKWLEKYSDNGNDRNKRNVEVISSGVDSHIYMAMNKLMERINQ